MTSETGSELDDLQRIELSVGGMTCASCAARVEKKLNKLDGASASVNYATEKARVFYPATLSTADLIDTVEKAGYTARAIESPHARRTGTSQPASTTNAGGSAGAAPPSGSGAGPNGAPPSGSGAGPNGAPPSGYGAGPNGVARATPSASAEAASESVATPSTSHSAAEPNGAPYLTPSASAEAGDGLTGVTPARSTTVPNGTPGASAEAPDSADPIERAKAEELQALGRRTLISAALSIPVILLAMVPPLQFTYWQWLSLTLAAPVVVWGAWPFHHAAWTNLRHGAATMDTLISMGTLAAFGWSLYALFLGSAGMPGMQHTFSLTVGGGAADANIYLEVAAGVTTFILAGRYFELKSRRRAGDALRALLDLGAKDVTILRDGQEIRRPAAELTVGEEFVVRPGEKIATDGAVVSGSSAVDNSMITGESVPEEVTEGHAVVGAALNQGGRIVVRATRVGADTQLAQMAALVEEAQNGKAQVQRLADRISAVFVPVVVLIALGTLIAWLATGAGAAQAFTAAVAVLIIACPCALGLATPTALLVGTGRGAQMGVLIRGPEVLESTRRIDTVVLDKTGTVTTGHMTVHAVHTAAGTSSEEILALAGSLEHASEHPIARAIVTAAAEAAAGRPDSVTGAAPDPVTGGSPAPVTGAGTPDPVTAPSPTTALAPVTDFENLPGLGVRGRVHGTEVLLGRPALLRQEGLSIGADLEAAVDAASSRGRTVIAAGWNGRAHGVIEVGDTIKGTSAEAIEQLRRLGLQPILLTGDTRAAAQQVAAQVGITEVIAEVLPEHKVDAVRRLQEDGKVVAMVGDGVNDAAALATADLGLAMGTGTDAAIQAGDITLVRGDLRAAVDAVRLSRRTLGTIKGNLFWAFAYNVAAIPVAAAGLLNPMLAGAAMACSSVFVVSNSLRLRRFRSTITPAG